MLGDTEHGEWRSGGPNHEMTLVPQGQSQEIWELPMHNGEEDGVSGSRLAAQVGAIAQDKAERVGCLMPGLIPHRGVRSIGVQSLQA